MSASHITSGPRHAPSGRSGAMSPSWLAPPGPHRSTATRPWRERAQPLALSTRASAIPVGFRDLMRQRGHSVGTPFGAEVPEAAVGHPQCHHHQVLDEHGASNHGASRERAKAVLRAMPIGSCALYGSRLSEHVDSAVRPPVRGAPPSPRLRRGVARYELDSNRPVAKPFHLACVCTALPQEMIDRYQNNAEQERCRRKKRLGSWVSWTLRDPLHVQASTHLLY